MAGNRLQRIGSIFERMTGLLKAGAIKEQDKPIWYDVYKTFPPKHEPTFARPPVEKTINPIFYPEDVIRGKFLKIFGSPDVHNLMKPGEKSIMQRFVEKYQEIEKSRKFSNEDDIFRATESALEQDGLKFVRAAPANRSIVGSLDEKKD
ncbi:28S ribosomal protein S23, mitochondrial [Araneus ventricosus]|uniref:Small ribosomal subunit protein mS23 n=1 Tax=Araneus ventricosus TaxID=182803 RepID=A0A4Y2P6D1_ARAVE|nr:28S ribosomal protein S23, mitochondrial [Araneus ventricosus]